TEAVDSGVAGLMNEFALDALGAQMSCRRARRGKMNISEMRDTPPKPFFRERLDRRRCSQPGFDMRNRAAAIATRCGAGVRRERVALDENATGAMARDHGPKLSPQV